ncbi:hypothetical protein [Mesorhizobium sp. M6A.T.Ce.TU.002.03.1.1]|uniref:hypothetical protein n=1 Tax=Mesorhizobium sp. M6A.T.Ce.TU.002.03.1.1 TaxID=2496782 RepID=UPI0019D1A862|nr:hypothetical protein [Mesorhizobium sp. M6A.T.Ce.TU.002.03.1.1]
MRRQMAGGEFDADQAMAAFARIDLSDLPEVERRVAVCPDPAGKIVVAFPSGTRLRFAIVDPKALRIVPGDHGGPDRLDLLVLRRDRHASRDQQPGADGQ